MKDPKEHMHELKKQISADLDQLGLNEIQEPPPKKNGGCISCKWYVHGTANCYPSDAPTNWDTTYGAQIVPVTKYTSNYTGNCKYYKKSRTRPLIRLFMTDAGDATIGSFVLAIATAIASIVLILSQIGT